MRRILVPYVLVLISFAEPHLPPTSSPRKLWRNCLKACVLLSHHFTPPPNDKFGVTKEELVIALRQIFASRGDMGKKHVIPMLLNKLSDTSIPISPGSMSWRRCLVVLIRTLHRSMA